MISHECLFGKPILISQCWCWNPQLQLMRGWARPESNWRSSPCQGDVITLDHEPVCPDLEPDVQRAIGCGHPMIFEIRPLHPSLPHDPAMRLRPLLMVLI